MAFASSSGIGDASPSARLPMQGRAGRMRTSRADPRSGETSYMPFASGAFRKRDALERGDSARRSANGDAGSSTGSGVAAAIASPALPSASVSAAPDPAEPRPRSRRSRLAPRLRRHDLLRQAPATARQALRLRLRPRASSAWRQALQAPASAAGSSTTAAGSSVSAAASIVSAGGSSSPFSIRCSA
jgi:hypothetical protein